MIPSLTEALHDPSVLVGTVWHSKPGPTKRRMVVVAVGKVEYGVVKVLTRSVETRRMSTLAVSRVFSNYVCEGRAKNAPQRTRSAGPSRTGRPGERQG